MNEKIKNDIAKLIAFADSYSNWEHIYGMIMFEFYPNKISAPRIYLENKNTFKNLTSSKTGFVYDILSISGDIHEHIEEDEKLIKKPDLMLFTIDHDTMVPDCVFKYGVFDDPDYSSMDEMLYFDYHLMGLIPESDFNRRLLNNALRYHGEKPLD